MHDTDRRRGRAARPGPPRAKVLNVVRVSSGNFLEMFDFMVFGYYASSIGRTFFPNENAFASLMLALMTFGAGFLMRPIGTVILGAYIDRFGRRSGLILTLGLMAIGTLLIACLPGYAVIGVAAPIVILISRLIQGFSAGVELGGVSVYLSEIATPGHKGFYVSWQSASQQVAVMFAALISVVLHSLLPPATMEQWAAGNLTQAKARAMLPWPFGPSRRLLQVKRSPEFTSLSAASRLRRYNSRYRKSKANHSGNGWPSKC